MQNSPAKYTPKSKEELYESSFFHFQHNDHTDIEIPFSIYYLVGRTMHRMGRDGVPGFDFKKIGIKDNDVVVFVVGSIDRDGHVAGQMPKIDCDEIIDTLCRNYINTLTENKSSYKNLTVFVFGVIPVYIQFFMFDYTVYKNQTYEFTLKKQVIIGEKINKKLEEYCKENDLLYLDSTKFFASEAGDLKRELSDSGHHINPQYNYLIKNKLISMLISYSTQSNQIKN